jgi:hypothetical protein
MCEKIDAEFQAKLADILKKDNSTEDEAAEAEVGDGIQNNQGSQNDKNKGQQNN